MDLAVTPKRPVVTPEAEHDLVLGGMCWPSFPLNWTVPPLNLWVRREHAIWRRQCRELPGQEDGEGHIAADVTPGAVEPIDPLTDRFWIRSCRCPPTWPPGT